MRIRVDIYVKATPGDKVWVSNYRKSDEWEQGEVRSTEINVNNDGTPSVRYDVFVARTPKNPRGKSGYNIGVRDDRIQLITE